MNTNGEGGGFRATGDAVECEFDEEQNDKIYEYSRRELVRRWRKRPFKLLRRARPIRRWRG